MHVRHLFLHAWMQVPARLRRCGSTAMGMLLFVATGFGLVSSARAETPGTPSGFIMEVEMADPNGGLAQLFYNTGFGYNQHDSVTVQIPAGDTLRPVRFAIPAAPIKHVRLDPTTGETTLRMGEWRLFTTDGRLVARFGPEHVRAMFDIKSITLTGGIATIHTGGTDPMLFVDEPLHALTLRTLGRHTIGWAGVLAISIAVFAASAVAVIGAIRAARSGSTRPGWLLFAGVFLAVLGARLYWLSEYSRAMPFWDEWESDALYLLIPISGGFLDPQALTILQSEHRILVTRLITLAGTALNGEWDPRLGMVAGAAMTALTAAIASLAAMKAGRLLGGIGTILVTAALMLPFDQANLLWGGQSQMFALNLFAICVLALAAGETIDALAFVAALFAGLISLVTMGAGFVAPAIAAGICAVRFAWEPGKRRGLAALAVLFTATAIAGLLWREASHWHELVYAHSIAEFWTALKAFGAWPLPAGAVWLLVLFAPNLAVAALTLTRKTRGSLPWLAIGLGAWAFIAAAGLAHGRPQLASSIESKYFTALSFAPIASVLSTLVLLRYFSSIWPRLVFSAATLAAVVALFVSGVQGKGGAAQHFNYWTDQDQLVHQFLATDDRALLQDVGPSKVPYWNSAELAERLDSPLLQRFLPAELRVQLNKRPGVKLDPSPGPLTRAMLGAMRFSWLLAGAGGLAVLAALLRRDEAHARP